MPSKRSILVSAATLVLIVGADVRSARAEGSRSATTTRAKFVSQTQPQPQNLVVEPLIPDQPDSYQKVPARDPHQADRAELSYQHGPQPHPDSPSATDPEMVKAARKAARKKARQVAQPVQHTVPPPPHGPMPPQGHVPPHGHFPPDLAGGYPLVPVLAAQTRCGMTVMVPCEINETVLRTVFLEVPIEKQRVVERCEMRWVEEQLPMTTYDARRCCNVTTYCVQRHLKPTMVKDIEYYTEMEMVATQRPFPVKKTVYKPLVVVCAD